MKSWWIKIYCRSKFPFHINTLKSICFPVPINTVQWAIIYIFLLSVFVQHLHLVCNFTRYIHYQNVVSISLFMSLVTWGWLCFLIHWEYLVLLVTHACVVCRVPTWLILSATTKACNAGSTPGWAHLICRLKMQTKQQFFEKKMLHFFPPSLDCKDFSQSASLRMKRYVSWERGLIEFLPTAFIRSNWLHVQCLVFGGTVGSLSDPSAGLLGRELVVSSKTLAAAWCQVVYSPRQRAGQFFLWNTQWNGFGQCV